MSDYVLPSNLTDEELHLLEDKFIAEYNAITEPYRAIFSKISQEFKRRQTEKCEKCNHVWEKEPGFHNDKYYICKLCGLEK
jgi:hypothetical protein